MEKEFNNVKSGKMRKRNMKYCGSLYVIKDSEKTKAFYKEILGLRVITDFGANFVLTGGISFQTLDSWQNFIEKSTDDIYLNANNGEMYFESEDLDDFIKRLDSRDDIEYVHPLKTHDWGQRGIRIYDPDHHIIEISETLSNVCKRFIEQGLNLQEISQKTMLSERMINRLLKK